MTTKCTKPENWFLLVVCVLYLTLANDIVDTRPLDNNAKPRTLEKEYERSINAEEVSKEVKKLVLHSDQHGGGKDQFEENLEDSGLLNDFLNTEYYVGKPVSYSDDDFYFADYGVYDKKSLANQGFEDPLQSSNELTTARFLEPTNDNAEEQHGQKSDEFLYSTRQMDKEFPLDYREESAREPFDNFDNKPFQSNVAEGSDTSSVIAGQTRGDSNRNPALLSSHSPAGDVVDVPIVGLKKLNEGIGEMKNDYMYVDPPDTENIIIGEDDNTDDYLSRIDDLQYEILNNEPKSVQGLRHSNNAFGSRQTISDTGETIAKSTKTKPSFSVVNGGIFVDRPKERHTQVALPTSEAESELHKLTQALKHFEVKELTDKNAAPEETSDRVNVVDNVDQGNNDLETKSLSVIQYMMDLIKLPIQMLNVAARLTGTDVIDLVNENNHARKVILIPRMLKSLEAPKQSRLVDTDDKELRKLQGQSSQPAWVRVLQRGSRKQGSDDVSEPVGQNSDPHSIQPIDGSQHTTLLYTTVKTLSNQASETSKDINTSRQNNYYLTGVASREPPIENTTPTDAQMRKVETKDGPGADETLHIEKGESDRLFYQMNNGPNNQRKLIHVTKLTRSRKLRDVNINIKMATGKSFTNSNINGDDKPSTTPSAAIIQNSYTSERPFSRREYDIQWTPGSPGTVSRKPKYTLKARYRRDLHISQRSSKSQDRPVGDEVHLKEWKETHEDEVNTRIVGTRAELAEWRHREMTMSMIGILLMVVILAIMMAMQRLCCTCVRTDTGYRCRFFVCCEDIMEGILYDGFFDTVRNIVCCRVGLEQDVEDEEFMIAHKHQPKAAKTDPKYYTPPTGQVKPAVIVDKDRGRKAKTTTVTKKESASSKTSASKSKKASKSKGEHKQQHHKSGHNISSQSREDSPSPSFEDLIKRQRVEAIGGYSSSNDEGFDES